jgi:hypothetical protein
MNKPSLVALVPLAVSLLAFSSAFAQQASSQTSPPQSSSQSPDKNAAPGNPDPHSTPTLDGGIGPCSADFTITDKAGAPVYNAMVSVHIAYGTWSIRKLDLQVNTNVDGKARFTGLPDRIKHGIIFHASEGTRTGEAFDDPAITCKAQFTIALHETQ